MKATMNGREVEAINPTATIDAHLAELKSLPLIARARRYQEIMAEQEEAEARTKKVQERERVMALFRERLELLGATHVSPPVFDDALGVPRADVDGVTVCLTEVMRTRNALRVVFPCPTCGKPNCVTSDEFNAASLGQFASAIGAGVTENRVCAECTKQRNAIRDEKHRNEREEAEKFGRLMSDGERDLIVALRKILEERGE